MEFQKLFIWIMQFNKQQQHQKRSLLDEMIQISNLKSMEQQTTNKHNDTLHSL